MTSQNNLNLFNFAMKNHPGFIALLVPIYFFSLFLVIIFIIAMMTYFYVKLTRRNIRNLNNYRSFRKVFYYFKDNKGIVDYTKLETFIDDFFKDPKKIDFKKYEKRMTIKVENEKFFRDKIKELSYNAKHHKEFVNIRRQTVYKLITILIDTILAISPVLVCNFPSKNLNNIWYFWLIVLSGLSIVDPFLCLIFNGHKISNLRRKVYVFKILISFFIMLMCLLLPLQGTKINLTLEQSNDILFITFSICCFMKLITFIDEVLMRNTIIFKIVGLAKQTVPFIIKMLTIYAILLTFYVCVGKYLYAMDINSSTIDKYERAYGYKLREKYQYFHFNDNFSAYLTLFVIVLQNNWIYIVEMMYFIRPGIETTIYIVSFNVFVAFTCTSLVLGVIARLIILYFDEDFEEIRDNIGKDAYTDIVSKSKVSDEIENY